MKSFGLYTTAILLGLLAVSSTAVSSTENVKDRNCSDFGKKEFEKNYIDGFAYEIEYSGVKDGPSGFTRASVYPDKTKTLKDLIVKNRSQSGNYRIVFALVHKPEYIPDVLRAHGKKFKSAGPEWTIKMTAPPVIKGGKEQVLVLTQDSPGAAHLISGNGRAPGALTEFARNKEVTYFTSPLIPEHGGLDVESGEGAPLFLARYAILLSEEGIALDAYDGTGKKKQAVCLVRAEEVETEGLVATDGDRKNVFDIQNAALKKRQELEIPPVDFQQTLNEDQLQRRVDGLTNGMVWLSIEVLEVTNKTYTGVTQACTGFFVTTDLIMTARHCLKKSGFDCLGATRCHVRGWIRQPGGDTRAKAPEYQDLEPVLWGRMQGDNFLKSIRGVLDYAVLRVPSGLSVKPDRQPLKLKAEGATPSPFFLPQFPNGRQFVFSLDEHCGTRFDRKTTPPSDNSMIRNKEIEEFYHFCDTTEISSGAPVLDPDLEAVRGVHVAGYQEKPDDGNTAVKASFILKDLKDLIEFCVEKPDHFYCTVDDFGKVSGEILDFNKGAEGS